jgi:hypothetical protein
VETAAAGTLRANRFQLPCRYGVRVPCTTG